ncbi:DUF2807 domain-containing protein [Ancylomarina sp. DW003]|nr:head GIN domain-containing protein [Ancylomarina sp. DW003]MDE5423813.1 DUF2807 domain-containing protein [Ancylomarina sp. DW003]
MQRVIYILLLFFILSCNFINPFHDEGKDVEKIIELGDFTQIEIHNIFNIVIIEDSETYIIYKGGENVFEDMNYSISDETLKINHNFVNWTNNFNIPILEIHVTNLQRIDTYTPCNISSSNQLTGDKLSINIREESEAYEINLNINFTQLRFHTQNSVGGTFTVSGTCPNAIYTLNGSTNIQTLNLVSNEVHIAQNSLGDAYIYTASKLSATFYKSGDIYYSGNPETIEVKYDQINNQDASGKLIQISD